MLSAGLSSQIEMLLSWFISGSNSEFILGLALILPLTRSKTLYKQRKGLPQPETEQRRIFQCGLNCFHSRDDFSSSVWPGAAAVGLICPSSPLRNHLTTPSCLCHRHPSCSTQVQGQCNASQVCFSQLCVTLHVTTASLFQSCKVVCINSGQSTEEAKGSSFSH